MSAVRASLQLVPRLRWFVALADPDLAAAVAALRVRLDDAGLRDVGDLGRAVPGGPAADAEATVVWVDHPLPDETVSALLAAGRPLVLAGDTLERADPEGALAEAAGLVPGQPTARHDIRVRPGRHGEAVAVRLLDHAHTGGAHLGDHVHVHDRVLRLDKTGDDVEVLLSATVGQTEHPVAAWRASSGVLTWTLGTTAEAVAGRSVTRLLLLALRHALGLGPAPVTRVGLLGYGAIGHEHNRALRQIDGLALAAVCDTSPERIAAARRHAPDVRGYSAGEDLLADPALDAIVVSTPPNTHAFWALAALRAGKHVVVEKPFALSTEDADAGAGRGVGERPARDGLPEPQVRPRSLAIARAVRAGLLGDLFHLEAFVGGYGHPCNLWHSDVAVSGGAVYDWGAHVLDQLLDLMPGPIEHVTAVEQKRVWLDVTNADHARVTVRFDGGAEASFVYSDLAAALKPRWYLLGTRGAIVGQLAQGERDRAQRHRHPGRGRAGARGLPARARPARRRRLGDPAGHPAGAAVRLPPRAGRPAAARAADVGDR